MSQTATEVEKILKFDLPKIDKKVITTLESDFSVNKKSKTIMTLILILFYRTT